jgi:hypothetical protein
MLSSLSSTIITVFDMADLPKSTLFPRSESAAASSLVQRLATQPSTGVGTGVVDLKFPPGCGKLA